VTRGRPPTYPLRLMAVGDSRVMHAATPADVKRIARNVSTYGKRHNARYVTATDSQTRVLTITRVA